jgi:hypothetical protein
MIVYMLRHKSGKYFKPNRTRWSKETYPDSILRDVGKIYTTKPSINWACRNKRERDDWEIKEFILHEM